MHELRVDRELVKRLEEMVRISLTPEEEERMISELSKILEWMRVLLDAKVVGDPLYHPSDVEGLLRRDDPKPSLPREEALRNAVEVIDGFVKAPKLVEE
ncbi:glutamyl-tRNA(Gln) amidotransferase, C subunit [Pyrolobus fumarii 1A]|uniref:Aspartyl/glutamyl-tRNA(Asn/Gln) amidotransferase subunit C n=1 Tax=Pyrolobus fumarii (strain DSM 11204 / 1A) TaxID=694429 RepID=G0EF96_PYRF1|nr:Asp-tRNA(Asn)/Glu-tRNA(Gln) amidotransferase subunit GatC [Pyrolobus fumarii]AEM38139.1 glutamyl-tRNA(Gln) amidotransferase, C subunit [Pyrolobus fumarii 1A]